MSRLDELTPEKILRIQRTVEALMQLHKAGALGGETMPEDANPGLTKSSDENYLYFTLPMALNYQRNSYRLWESAEKTYNDPETIDVFTPKITAGMSPENLRDKLVKYKLAIQPIKQPQIWFQLCSTFMQDFNGSIKLFFATNDYSVAKIKEYMTANKRGFPYLSGEKIMNYWLYVMSQYTDAVFIDRENITVAPDTHVIQASVKLGLIHSEDIDTPNIRSIVSELWAVVFKGSKWQPIDIHTPLWLWSRGGFTISADNVKEQL